MELLKSIARKILQEEIENYEIRLREKSYKINDLRNEKRVLEAKVQEMECIIPKIESGEIKSCVSKKCKTCMYSVTSDVSRDVYGCVKDCVCEDYMRDNNKPMDYRDALELYKGKGVVRC